MTLVPGRFNLLDASPRTGTRLAGFGAALPHRSLSAAQLGSPFGRTAEWVEARTGITALGRVHTQAELLGLAQRATTRALESAGLTTQDLDLVVTTSCSAVRGPRDVGRLAAAVAPGVATMHVNAACSGFCYALSSADSLIRTGSARRVLVLGAERMSALLDPSDLGTSVIFGDGAGAAVLMADEAGTSGIGPVVWGSDGMQSEVIECRDDGCLAMAGSQVFRWAVETVPELARAACDRAGVHLDDIQVFVPHQANLRIVRAVVDKLGLTDVIVADSVRTVGNTSAASIPIALAGLADRGLLAGGQLALLAGFGAGLSWAAQVVRLP